MVTKINKKANLEATFYIVAILVFMLLLFGILASIFVSRNIEQGKSLTDEYDERVASLKTLSGIDVIKFIFIIAIIGIILYLWDRFKITKAKVRHKSKKSSRKKKKR